jgi:hypothetical protein
MQPKKTLACLTAAVAMAFAGVPESSRANEPQESHTIRLYRAKFENATSADRVTQLKGLCRSACDGEDQYRACKTQCNELANTKLSALKRTSDEGGSSDRKRVTPKRVNPPKQKRAKKMSASGGGAASGAPSGAADTPLADTMMHYLETAAGCKRGSIPTPGEKPGTFECEQIRDVLEADGMVFDLAETRGHEQCIPPEKLNLCPPVDTVNPTARQLQALFAFLETPFNLHPGASPREAIDIALSAMAFKAKKEKAEKEKVVVEEDSGCSGDSLKYLLGVLGLTGLVWWVRRRFCAGRIRQQEPSATGGSPPKIQTPVPSQNQAAHPPASDARSSSVQAAPQTKVVPPRGRKRKKSFKAL